MGDGRRFYEGPVAGHRRSAPAALRNRDAIAEVLEEWLPASGKLLEIASGTGEHAIYFAERFPGLEWQPSDIHEDALRSIEAWREAAAIPNLMAPIALDASSSWPKVQGEGGFSAILCINMVHISPWGASLGLLEGAAKVLRAQGVLILYGPWLKADLPTAPSNLAFDQQLKARDPSWGLRRVEDFEADAQKRGFVLEDVRTMPANNLMLLLRPNRTHQ